MLGVAYANATVYYVSPGGNGTNGLSWATAFPSLEVAQNSVSSPAEIWVQQGTYNVTDSLIFISGVNVYGGFTGTETSLNARNTDPSLTVLNGNKKRGVIYTSAMAVETIWDGFTIQNGKNGNGGGIAMYNNTTLKNCIVQNNSNVTNSGGGIYMQTNATDSVKLIDCTVRNNVVYYNGVSTSPIGGGGVYIYAGSLAAVIRGCTIEGNMVNGESFSSAKMYGGGVFMNDGTIENTVINSNRATSLDPETSELKVTGTLSGGGLFIMPGANNSTITVKGCTVSGNSAEVSQGGGMMINPYWTGTILSGKVNIINSKFINNYSRTHGGGILCDSQNTSSTLEYTFTNCIVANNLTETQQGGGAFINNKPPTVVKFTNSTIVNNKMNVYNYGGAGLFYNNIAADITNCIFRGNLNAGTSPLKHNLRTSGAEGNMVVYCAFDPSYKESEISPTSNPADLSGLVLIAANNTATDSLAARFASPTNFAGIAVTEADYASLAQADWSLTTGSALIDAGATVRTLAYDILNKERPLGDGYDIGAYEFDIAAGIKSNNQNLSSVYGLSGEIIFNNQDDIREINIYGLTGSLLKSVRVSGGLNHIAVPAGQLYIVRAGMNAHKVLVK